MRIQNTYIAEWGVNRIEASVLTVQVGTGGIIKLRVTKDNEETVEICLPLHELKQLVQALAGVP